MAVGSILGSLENETNELMPAKSDAKHDTEKVHRAQAIDLSLRCEKWLKSTKLIHKRFLRRVPKAISQKVMFCPFSKLKMQTQCR